MLPHPVVNIACQKNKLIRKSGTVTNYLISDNIKVFKNNTYSPGTKHINTNIWKVWKNKIDGQQFVSMLTSKLSSQLFTRMASIIDIFNSVCVNNKPYRSFKNLTIGEHIIKNFYRVNAKIGVRIRIETSQSSLFLPEQFPWREDIDCICLKKSESGGSRPIESDFGYWSYASTG